jgi:hypothetical protein
MAIFHTVVRRLINITLRGQPCKMPFVAQKKEPSEPPTLKARRKPWYICTKGATTYSCNPMAVAIEITTF